MIFKLTEVKYFFLIKKGATMSTCRRVRNRGTGTSHLHLPSWETIAINISQCDYHKFHSNNKQTTTNDGIKARTHDASLRATLRHEVARNVADYGHTVLRVMLQKYVGADSTSATVGRNVARNNFKAGHMAQLSIRCAMLRAVLHRVSWP